MTDAINPPPGLFPGLTPAQQGTFVTYLLNKLPHPEDLAEGQPFVELCCPDCCAPCNILRGLLDAGTLNDIIRQAPPHHFDDLAWWTGDGVNEQWLRSCWACTSRPPCREAL